MRRVLVDTNVIISASLFPDSAPAVAFGRILASDRLVATRWIIDELHAVVERQRPDLVSAVDALLASIEYEIAEPGAKRGNIADPGDQPILDAALSSDVDVIISGDKHFLSLGLERPEIMTPRAYLDCVPDFG